MAVIRFRVAGLWRRALATTVDCLLLSPFAVVLYFAQGLFPGARAFHWRELGIDSLVEILLGRDSVALACLGVYGVLAALYFVLFQAIRGQTPGQRLLGLRVITPAGARPTVWRALARTLAFGPSAALFGLGLLWIGFDREKRGLHDWLAGTYVVRNSSR
jgi:uncharacterized RDD family membrane protein YckC